MIENLKTVETFQLTEDHLKLLNHMYIQWGDDGYEGAPAVGIKRPYGNSDVFGDIAEIVADWPLPKRNYRDDYMLYNADGDIVRVEARDGRTFRHADFERLHKETETALQIVLCTRSFMPGLYIKTNQYYRLSWVLASSLPNE